MVPKKALGNSYWEEKESPLAFQEQFSENAKIPTMEKSHGKNATRSSTTLQLTRHVQCKQTADCHFFFHFLKLFWALFELLHEVKQKSIKFSAIWPQFWWWSRFLENDAFPDECFDDGANEDANDHHGWLGQVDQVKSYFLTCLNSNLISPRPSVCSRSRVN